MGLTENLTFARDRSVECFLWSTGVASDYQFGSLRKTLTKAIYLILILDDVYDIYGSQFTNAIDRWDSKEIEKLPDRIKRCFDALSSTTNEAALDIQKEKGWKCVLPHLKKAVRILVRILNFLTFFLFQWVNFCKSLLVEAKWYHEGHTPALGEYLSNAWISSSGARALHPCLHLYSR